MLSSLNICSRGRIEQNFLPLLILLDCLTVPFAEKYYRHTNQIGSSGRASPTHVVLPEIPMTAYALSLLDKSPTAQGETPTQALTRSVDLARHAEAWGYRRYWLAEHHNTSQLACPSPEILIAYILAHTSRIRIGSGGVMLQHYSPYKVAENFNLLASLAPGRVDLGIGKAPGGLPLSTRALQSTHDHAHKPDFAALAFELDRYLAENREHGAGDGEEQFGSVLRATPLPPSPARPFLLGASIDSAALAARLGWDFVYAAHINGAPDEIERAFERYRVASNGRKPLLAISVIAAQTTAEAERLASNTQRFRVQVGDQQPVTVGSIAQAEEFVRQAGGGAHRIEARETHIVHGTPDAVHDALGELQHRHGVDEFIVDNPVTDAAQRLASVRLLARGLLHGEGSYAAEATRD